MNENLQGPVIPLQDALPVLRSIESKYSLPAGLLAGLYQTESGGKPRPNVEGSGAGGYFQFMPGTAKQYGANIGNLSSEADAAARYMNDLISQSGGDVGKALGTYGGFKTKDPSGYLSKVAAYMDNNIFGGTGAPIKAAPLASMPGFQQAQEKGEEYVKKYEESSQKAAEGALQRQQDIIQRQQEALGALGEAPKVPDYIQKPQPLDIKELPNMFNAMMIVGALAGMNVKGPTSAALGNLTGILSGINEGDKERINREYENFKLNHTQAMDKLHSYQENLKSIYERTKGDLAQSKEEYRLEMLRNGVDPKILDYYSSKNPHLIGQMEHSAQQGQLQMAKLQGMIDGSLGGGKANVYVDPQTKVGYRVKPNGTAQKQNPDGSWTNVNVNEVPQAALEYAKGSGGAINQRFASRVNANMLNLATHMNNLLDMPSGTTLGTFRDIANMKGQGLYSALEALSAQKITDTESRLFDQYLAGTALELGYIGSSGVGGGSARHVLDEWNKIAPKAGDSRVSMLAFLALLKQTYKNEVETFETMPGANEQQKAGLRNRLAQLDNLIKWDVSDVNQISKAQLGDKSSILDEMHNLLNMGSEGTMNYKSEQDYDPNTPYTGSSDKVTAPSHTETKKPSAVPSLPAGFKPL